ncbi:unnamed protein product [Rotaria sp. Silwood2]|nr:unnamed protein product [Rotaria sp. Silwood2]CAF4651096.1 unnamed protein product [Rotaria sp. Silwood2]
MSNSTTNNLIVNLNIATFWINRIIPVISIVFGTFGNLFNIIIFTRRSLCNNPCSMYFLAGSIANFFVMYVALLTRYLATSWNLDPAATNMIWCKIRYFLIYPPLCLVLWFVVLASIDRFFLSSHNVRLRQLSSLSRARKTIIITTVFMFLINIHVFVFARSVIINGIPNCTILPNEYVVFFNFFVRIVSCILPLTLMCIFGILTIINVRMVGNRVISQDNNMRNERLRSNDRQLIIMLLLQVLIIFIFVAPWTLINMHNSIALTILNQKFSASQQAIYDFLFNLFRMLYYINPSIGFYIYTLSGPRFRIELKHCIKCGLKFTLTAMGLLQCLSLRIQRTLLDENQTCNKNTSLAKKGGRNTIHPDRHQTYMNNTSIV